MVFKKKKNLKTFFNKLIERVRSTSWQITVPLFFLLSFLPIRIIGLFVTNPDSKQLILFIGFVIVLGLAFFMESVIPYLLNTFIIQLLFFAFLEIENFIYSMESKFEVFFFSLCTYLCILLTPMLILAKFGVTLLTWWLFITIIFFTGYRLRKFFLFPEENLAIDMFHNGYLKPVNDEADFNWSTVVFNMDQLSKKLYSRGVHNRLGSRLEHKPLKAVGVRYVWFYSLFGRVMTGVAESVGQNIGRVAESVRKDPFIKGSVTAGTGIGAYFYHRDQQLAEKQHELNQKAQADEYKLNQKAQADEHELKTQVEAHDYKLKCRNQQNVEAETRHRMIEDRISKGDTKEEAIQYADQLYTVRGMEGYGLSPKKIDLPIFVNLEELEFYRRLYFELLDKGFTHDQACARIKSFKDVVGDNLPTPSGQPVIVENYELEAKGLKLEKPPVDVRRDDYPKVDAEGSSEISSNLPPHPNFSGPGVGSNSDIPALPPSNSKALSLCEESWIQKITFYAYEVFSWLI